MNNGFCPSHPDAKSQFLLVAKDTVSGDRFEVLACEQCGLARTEPQPSPGELDQYYPSGYHRASKRYRLGLDRTLSLLHGARIRRIEKLTGGPGRVLDVGCGPGWFLDHMRRRGWQTRGTERSESATRQAREVLQLDVRAQDLDELVREGLVYDAVVLWHVAEHLSDPASALRQIAQLLRPGGVLMIAVPNFGSPEARIGKDGWFHLDVPRHLFHFTQPTLTALLRDAGLEPKEEVHIAPEYDIFSFVQTAQNRMGFPPNLFYDVLRRREARLSHLGVRSNQSIATILAAVPLTLIGLLWTPLAAALGCSATMTIFAQHSPQVAPEGPNTAAGTGVPPQSK